jgi:hypothetical protein
VALCSSKPLARSYDHTSAFVSDQDLAPAVSIRDLNGSQELGGLDLLDSTEWTEVRFTELVLLPFADETEVPDNLLHMKQATGNYSGLLVESTRRRTIG